MPPRQSSLVSTPSLTRLEPLEPRTLLTVPATLSSTNTQLLPAGAIPDPIAAIVVADFNGDGINDIAATAAKPYGPNSGPDSAVWFLLGLGNGAFAAPIMTPLATPAESIAAGHFSATPGGQSDLAVLGSYGVVAPWTAPQGYVLRVLRFKPQTGGLRVVARIRFADPAGDGADPVYRGSFVVGNVTGGAHSSDEIIVKLQWGSSNQSPSTMRFFISIFGVAPGTNGSDDQIAFKATVKDGFYTTPYRFSLFTDNLQLADLDGDGVKEVIFSPGQATRAWFHASAAGPAHNITIYSGAVQHPSLKTLYAEVNGVPYAGRYNLGVSENGNPGHTTLQGSFGDGRFGIPIDLPTVAVANVNSPYATLRLLEPTCVIDLNGDFRPDIFFLWRSEDSKSFESVTGYDTLTTDPYGIFTASALTPLAAGENFFLLADVNNDRLPDLVGITNGALVARLNHF
jgi:hypothetical protein